MANTIYDIVDKYLVNASANGPDTWVLEKTRYTRALQNTQRSYLIFGKVRPYGIEFGGWQWRWRLVEKIVCPFYWQQSLWVSKQTVLVSLRPGGAAAVADCLTVHLLQLSHYQTKRNYRRKQSALGRQILSPLKNLMKSHSFLIQQWTTRAIVTSVSFLL